MSTAGKTLLNSASGDRSLLEVRDLRAAYDETEVVCGVSFGVPQGGIVCIVGESGSGKSTLIKAIHGMSQLKVTSGEILFEGKDLCSMDQVERRRLMGSGIGLIPQDPGASFNPIRRLGVQFKEALSSHSMPYDEGMIADILAKIGIPDGGAVLKNRPYELSGGMNQRVAIAAAMMFEPRLLMCDEATSALDVTTAGAVVDELLKIRDERGTSILMVTHHLGIAKRMADLIGIMKDGRMVEFGDTDKIFEAPENEYTKALIYNVPKL